MLGSPCARRLAEAGCSVLLVGQGEPTDRRTHDGVFASHHDDTRITRIVDPDPLRALLAHRSIETFRRLEGVTGERIVAEVGHLWVGPPSNVDEVAIADARFALGCTRMDPTALRGAFPALRLPAGVDGLHQPDRAGHLDPRAYVRAEGQACTSAGGTTVDALVDTVCPADRGVELTTSAGTFHADRVVLATGPFSAHGDTPAAGLELTVGTHTMVHVRLSPADAGRLADLPSLIVKTSDGEGECFVLPPTTRPDGHRVMKIGVSHQARPLGPDDLKAWFRSDGDPDAAVTQRHLLETLVPGLDATVVDTVPCVTTYTPSGHPVIDDLTDRVGVLIGGNGYAAKCAPALGELAAGRLLGESWPGDVDREPFVAPL